LRFRLFEDLDGGTAIDSFGGENSERTRLVVLAEPGAGQEGHASF
jgi:hypothetical protein